MAMNIEDAKTLIKSTIITLKFIKNPESEIHIQAMTTLLNRLEELESENKMLKSAKLIKEVKEICSNGDKKD